MQSCSSTSHDAASADSCLVEWDVLHRTFTQSMMPEEGEQRAGIVEDYLWGLLELVRRRRAMHAAAKAAEMRRVCRDEQEERRFIEEDAEMLPLVLFRDYTQLAVATMVARAECAARDEIEAEQRRAAAELLSQQERIARKTLCVEALDSMFLKLCQTQPGWMWRRLRHIETERQDRFVAQCRAVEQAERDARGALVSGFAQFLSVALVQLARFEKAQLFALHQPPKYTATDLFVDCSIRIQSAYRGHRTRRQLQTAL